MQLRYAFRVYPDTGQERALAQAFGCARVVFNEAVRAREEARAAKQPFPRAAELSKRLITEAKQTAERAWPGEVSAVVLQQSLRNAEMAYRNFFASLKGTRKGPRTGPPARFKSRKDNRQSIRFTANARWSLTGSGRLNLPKIGAVRVKWSRTLPTTPTSVTVIKDAAGRYFASFVIDTDTAADQARMPATDRTIGIDLGLTHFAVLSDGTKIDSPRFLRRAEKKLKKAQRELSRKQKGSRNRAKTRVKVARAHAQVADARREFHHQLSTRLISENQGIAVENLSVAGLARTRLAKPVQDAGWSSFISMLEYKAARYGRTLVKIGRFEPTSQTCSTCGVKDGPKALNVREWTCSACGAVHDRDTNAAINVKKAAGLAVSACGAPIRPGAIRAQREEAGSHGLPTELVPRSGTATIEKARILALQGGEHVKSRCSRTRVGDTAIDEGYFHGRNMGPIPLPSGESVPAAQKELRIRGVDLAKVADGRIVSYRLYFDQMELLGQLGLLPEELL